MRKVRLVLIPALGLLIQCVPGISLQVANAAAVTATGTNPSVCNQVVGNSTNVSAVRLADGECVVQFRNVGTTTWTIPAGVISAWVLVIAGGGGGGGDEGGGGGAGGYREDENYSFSGLSTVNITVGDGGAGGTDDSASGENGDASSIGSYIAAGGGGGGTAGNATTAAGLEVRRGKAGGSGGGGAGENPTNSGGAASPSGQGFAGGSGSKSAQGAGGGGASEAGNTSGGATDYSEGGDGISSSITGANTVRAGGGGGGAGNTGSSTANGGAGGSGGGGRGGGTDRSGTAGTANTGGGGGGGGAPSGASLAGYSGGSGIVIVRYNPDTTAPTFTNSTSFSIAENTSTSTNAATITVSESSTFTITSGTDSTLFTIITSDSTTARIRFLTSPNFEAPSDVGTNNVYDLSVRATDTAGNIANQSISITVTNVNEAPTISTNSSAATYAITQAENISSVATYAATDVDAGASLSWSLSGTDAADFAIVSGTGVLTFASNPDYEAPADSDTNNTYIFIVTVSDGSLTDTQTVTITITNANESASIAAPTVSGSIYKGITTTITVTSSVAGKVRFFAGGKRISTCLSRTTTGSYPNYSATCSWKPAVQSKQLLTATITPTDNTFSAATSAATEVRVGRRGTVR